MIYQENKLKVQPLLFYHLKILFANYFFNKIAKYFLYRKKQIKDFVLKSNLDLPFSIKFIIELCKIYTEIKPKSRSLICNL